MEGPPDDRAQRRSIDRRTLIRRAAAAGAAAWAAPVILGSIASPAAAATFNGCYQASTRLNSTSGSTASWDSWSNGTQSTGIFGATCTSSLCSGSGSFVTSPATLLSAITATAANAPFGSNLVTVSVPTGCRIVAVGVATSPDTVDDLFNTPRCDTARYAVTGVGTGTVLITPNGGPVNTATSGFWDSSGPLHSTITVSIQCP